MRYKKIELEGVAREFKHYVRDCKHFRNRNITATAIAEELGVSRTVLSHAVNQQIGMSINEYINNQRVNYVNKLIEKNYKGYTLEDIILLSGFSCPSTYYRFIKKS